MASASRPAASSPATAAFSGALTHLEQQVDRQEGRLASQEKELASLGIRVVSLEEELRARGREHLQQIAGLNERITYVGRWNTGLKILLAVVTVIAAVALFKNGPPPRRLL